MASKLYSERTGSIVDDYVEQDVETARNLIVALCACEPKDHPFLVKASRTVFGEAIISLWNDAPENRGKDKIRLDAACPIFIRTCATILEGRNPSCDMRMQDRCVEYGHIFLATILAKKTQLEHCLNVIALHFLGMRYPKRLIDFNMVHAFNRHVGVDFMILISSLARYLPVAVSQLRLLQIASRAFDSPHGAVYGAKLEVETNRVDIIATMHNLTASMLAVKVVHVHSFEVFWHFREENRHEMDIPSNKCMELCIAPLRYLAKQNAIMLGTGDVDGSVGTAGFGDISVHKLLDACTDLFRISYDALFMRSDRICEKYSATSNVYLDFLGSAHDITTERGLRYDFIEALYVFAGRYLGLFIRMLRNKQMNGVNLNSQAIISAILCVLAGSCVVREYHEWMLHPDFRKGVSDMMLFAVKMFSMYDGLECQTPSWFATLISAAVFAINIPSRCLEELTKMEDPQAFLNENRIKIAAEFNILAMYISEAMFELTPTRVLERIFMIMFQNTLVKGSHSVLFVVAQLLKRKDLHRSTLEHLEAYFIAGSPKELRTYADQNPRPYHKDAIDSRCVVCFAKTDNMCGKCRCVRYCSNKCRDVEWKTIHRAECQVDGKVSANAFPLLMISCSDKESGVDDDAGEEEEDRVESYVEAVVGLNSLNLSSSE